MEQRTAMPLLELDYNLLLKILDYLPPESIHCLFVLNKISWQLAAQVKKNDTFWHNKNNKHFISVHDVREGEYHEFKANYQVFYSGDDDSRQTGVRIADYGEGAPYSKYDKDNKNFESIPVKIRYLFSLVKENDVFALQQYLKRDDVTFKLGYFLIADYKEMDMFDYGFRQGSQITLNYLYNYLVKKFDLQENVNELIYWSLKTNQSLKLIEQHFKSQGANANYVHINDEKLLEIVILYKRPDIVQLLLDHKAEFNSLLTFAVKYSTEEVIAILLKPSHFIENGVLNHISESPLLFAVQRNLSATVKTLLEIKTLDIKIKSTALKIAARNSHIAEEIIVDLINAGASFTGDFYRSSIEGSWPTSCLHMLVSNGRRQAVKLLIDKGVKIDLKSRPFEETIIKKVVAWGDIKLFDAMLTIGCDVNQGINDPRDGTPLNFATSCGDTKMVKHLLTQGATYDDPEHQEVLMVCAVESNEPEMFDFWLDKGLSLQFSIESQQKILTKAIYHSHFKMLTALLEKGIATQTRIEEYPYILVETYEKYYEYAGNTTKKGKDYSLASEAKRLIEVLINKDSIRESDKNILLYIAAKHNDMDYAKDLLKQGAQANVVFNDKHNLSKCCPILAAMASGNMNMFTLLLEHNGKTPIKIGKKGLLAYVMKKTWNEYSGEGYLPDRHKHKELVVMKLLEQLANSKISQEDKYHILAGVLYHNLSPEILRMVLDKNPPLENNSWYLPEELVAIGFELNTLPPLFIAYKAIDDLTSAIKKRVPLSNHNKCLKILNGSLGDIDFFKVKLTDLIVKEGRLNQQQIEKICSIKHPLIENGIIEALDSNKITQKQLQILGECQAIKHHTNFNIIVKLTFLAKNNIIQFSLKEVLRLFAVLINAHYVHDTVSPKLLAHLVQYVVKQGYSIDVIILYAGQKGCIDWIKQLVEHHGADINSAVHIAAEHGYTDLVKYLVQKPAADVCFAIACTIRNKQFKLTEYLIADNDELAKLAAEFYTQYGYTDLVKNLVEQHKVKTDLAVQYAAKSGCTELVKDLIANHGAKVDLAVLNAVIYGRTELVKDLVANHGARVELTVLNAAIHERVELIIDLFRIYNLHKNDGFYFRIIIKGAVDSKHLQSTTSTLDYLFAFDNYNLINQLATALRNSKSMLSANVQNDLPNISKKITSAFVLQQRYGLNPKLAYALKKHSELFLWLLQSARQIISQGLFPKNIVITITMNLLEAYSLPMTRQQVTDLMQKLPYMFQKQWLCDRLSDYPNQISWLTFSHHKDRAASLLTVVKQTDNLTQLKTLVKNQYCFFTNPKLKNQVASVTTVSSSQPKAKHEQPIDDTKVKDEFYSSVNASHLALAKY